MRVMTMNCAKMTGSMVALAQEIVQRDVDYVVMTEVGQTKQSGYPGGGGEGVLPADAETVVFADNPALLLVQLLRENGGVYTWAWSVTRLAGRLMLGVAIIAKVEIEAVWNKVITAETPIYDEGRRKLHVMQNATLTLAVGQVAVHRKRQQVEAERLRDYLTAQLRPVLLVINREAKAWFIRRGWVPCEDVAQHRTTLPRRSDVVMIDYGAAVLATETLYDVDGAGARSVMVTFA